MSRLTRHCDFGKLRGTEGRAWEGTLGLCLIPPLLHGSPIYFLALFSRGSQQLFLLFFLIRLTGSLRKDWAVGYPEDLLWSACWVLATGSASNQSLSLSLALKCQAGHWRLNCTICASKLRLPFPPLRLCVF